MADALRNADYYAILRRLPLRKLAIWLEKGLRSSNIVLIETIQRFKALESPVAILWGVDTIDFARSEELLYVGVSRAKSHLVLLERPGNLQEACRLAPRLIRCISRIRRDRGQLVSWPRSSTVWALDLPPVGINDAGPGATIC